MANNFWDIQSYEYDPFEGLLQLWISLGGVETSEKACKKTHSSNWAWCFEREAFLSSFNCKTEKFVSAQNNFQAYTKLKNFLYAGLNDYGKAKKKHLSNYVIEWSPSDHDYGRKDCVVLKRRTNAPAYVPHLYLKATTNADGRWVIVFHD